jgi:hypothetical protein
MQYRYTIQIQGSISVSKCDGSGTLLPIKVFGSESRQDPIRIWGGKNTIKERKKIAFSKSQKSYWKPWRLLLELRSPSWRTISRKFCLDKID